MKHLYEAVVTSEGGRDGRVVSDDGHLDLAVTPPPGLGGKGGATNPEQLFAAGYAACFNSAMQHIARTTKVQLLQPKVIATVGIGKQPQGDGFKLAVHLAVSAAGVDKPTLQKLADVAHQNICPYSHATRGNVEVTISVTQ